MSETTIKPSKLRYMESETVEIPSVSVETNQIASSLRELAAVSENLTDLIRKVSGVICSETECLAVWMAQHNPETGKIEIHNLTDQNDNTVSAIASEKLHSLIGTAFQSGELCSTNINEHHSIVASPIGAENSQFEMAIAGCFLTKGQSSVRHQWMMTLATQAIEQWLRRSELKRTKDESRFINEALSLCSVMDRSKSRQEAANYLVNHMRRLLGISQVVYCEGRSQQTAALSAISEVEQFDPHSESSRITLSAASVGIGEAEPVLYSANQELPETIHNLALDQYCKSNRFRSCACITTVDHEDNPTGSILIADSDKILSEVQLSQFKQFASVNGTHMDIVRRANLGPADMMREKLRKTSRKKWFRLTWQSALAVAVLMLIPIPYRVACDCEIQPVTRRFVSAPYTGPLERSVVRPGEVVSKDQILAYMDGQQLRLKLAGVEAERQAARRKHSSSLAQGEVAQSQIARSEIRKLDSELASLNDQLSRLEIRSPCDGIVISGDLDKAQGATMEIGQTLFEVAPLDAMLAEVAVPESEIQYVSDSNAVSIKLNAYPYRTFHGEINTIHPSAEVLDDESVFVADVKLDDENALIRPGMKGTAKIRTSWRPIGWNLFHNAWESVRCWLIW